MTTNERFEKAWDSFLIYLNRNPKAHLAPFLKERHVNHRTMQNWMSEKGYSVLRAKHEIREVQEAARRGKSRSLYCKYRRDVRAYGVSNYRSSYGGSSSRHKHNLSQWNRCVDQKRMRQVCYGVNETL